MAEWTPEQVQQLRADYLDGKRLTCPLCRGPVIAGEPDMPLQAQGEALLKCRACQVDEAVKIPGKARKS
jgi:hypothetical protein